MYLRDEEQYKIILRLKELLEEEMQCKYNLVYPDNQDSIDLVWDVEKKEAPPLLNDDWSDDVHLEMERRRWDKDEDLWVKDWTDPDPPVVYHVSLSDGDAWVHVGKPIALWFMAEKYYGVEVIEEFETLRERADRMKAALIIPAVIKDLMVYDRILAKVLSKYNISRSEVGASTCSLVYSPSLWLRFGKMQERGEEIGKEELIDYLFRGAKALAEWWRDYRAWLVSLERIKMYESTKVKISWTWKKGRGFIMLCKWPYDDKNYEFWVKKRLREFPHVYNLNRCLLKLVGDEIVVDCTKRIEPFPFEKIEFLREDFPELFE